MSRYLQFSSRDKKIASWKYNMMPKSHNRSPSTSKFMIPGDFVMPDASSGSMKIATEFLFYEEVKWSESSLKNSLQKLEKLYN